MTSSRVCNNLLIGVSGGIHCLNIHTYLVDLRARFAANVKVIMTATAMRMVAPQTVALYADDRIFADAWDSSESVRSPHIQLTGWAEVFMVLPATANVLGKAANGIADTLLATAILSSPIPIVFAPSMNRSMWSSAAVQRNVAALRADGHVVIDPVEGFAVSTREWGAGLGPTPELVFEHLMQVRMRALRREYYEEATRHRPRSPSEFKANARNAALADHASAAEASSATPG